MRLPLRIPAVLSAIFLLFACSGSAPSIDELKWQVFLRDDGEHRYEQLMVFARFSDVDDPGDPASVTIRAGDSGLVWRFSREEWFSDPLIGDWWSLPPMAGQAGFRLPDGRYTLRLEDLSGRPAEMEFRPDPDRLRLDEIEWPEVSVTDGKLTMSGTFPDSVLRTRDAEGIGIEVLDAEDGMQISDENAVTWEVWIPSEHGSGGFLLGPYPL